MKKSRTAWSTECQDIVTDCRIISCVWSIPQLGSTLNVKFNLSNTVMFLSFRTDRSGQTVQTHIRLLLEEQSDQGLYCLSFCLHRLDSLLYGSTTYIVVQILE